MAERKSAEEEFNPRHRIVGAVILVALAVIFLPMLLSDHPPEPRTTIPGAMPTPESRSAVVPGAPVPDAARAPDGEPAAAGMRSVTIPVEPAGKAAPVPPSAPSAPPTAEKAAPEKPVPAEPPTPPKAAKSTPPASSKPAPVSKGKWIVQMGVFSQMENAQRLQSKLRQKGYSAVLDPPRPAAGAPVRVEVGPYRDEAAAHAAATRLQGEFGIKGIVRKN